MASLPPALFQVQIFKKKLILSWPTICFQVDFWKLWVIYVLSWIKGFIFTDPNCSKKFDDILFIFSLKNYASYISYKMYGKTNSKYNEIVK